ncbi:MAG: YicC/YloC family endoribonuclease [Candidatus Omnitrophota bacterium]
MATSMTGFGRGESKGKWGTIVVEARSLNHRYLELTCRLPSNLVSLEDRLREALSKKLKRGRLILTVTLEKDGGAASLVRIDEKQARRCYENLATLKKELNLQGEVTVSDLLLFPDVVRADTTKEGIQEIWLQLREALEKAVDQLVEMRESEGKTLTQDLLHRVGLIEKETARITKRAPAVLKQYRARLASRVKELAGSEKLNRDRLEQEVVFFAENSDITEELTRMQAHLKSLQKALAVKEEVGRKLDFIAQELQREVNTVGQKSHDVEISQSVVLIKGEIERIREQIQNVA